MLRDLEHKAVALIVGLERVQDLGQVLGELDVHHGPAAVFFSCFLVSAITGDFFAMTSVPYDLSD
jgi:hypothetical protein